MVLRGASATSAAPVLLDLTEVANRLSLKRYVVADLVRQGRIESVQVSPRVRRVEPAALDRFVAERSQGPQVRQVRQVNNGSGKRGAR